MQRIQKQEILSILILHTFGKGRITPMALKRVATLLANMSTVEMLEQSGIKDAK